MAINAILAPPRGRLPLQANVLVGRERAVTTVHDILTSPTCRLLTLLGVGGIGKTRLALAVAEAEANTFADGVCFVDLVQIADATELPSLLSAELHLGWDARPPLDRVIGYLGDRQMLLLLDNFEHVIPGAQVVSEILERCPLVTVLVTSRGSLRVRWEQRMVVSPLDVPDLHLGPTTEELRGNPSVALFLQRARAVNLRFAADDETLRQIAALCVRLDGIPLAIELAAARTTVLSPAAILERFDASAALLHQDAPDTPVRQRSIHATLDWSYRLLSAEAQRAFRRLGIFVGGFSLEAAESVIHREGEHHDTLELLSLLADSSLIVTDLSVEDAPRYRQLDTIRSYALEQLRREGEGDTAAWAHARFFTSLAESESARMQRTGVMIFSTVTATRDSLDPKRPLVPVVLDREYANLQAALNWARLHDDTLFVRLSAALATYWWLRGYMQEGTQAVERALSLIPDAEPALRSQVLDALGVLYRQQADFERAHLLMEEAVSLARKVGDRQLLVRSLIDLGSVVANQGHRADAAQLFEEAATLAQEEENTWERAIALAHQGWLFMLDRRPEEAEAKFSASLVLFRDLGDRFSVALLDAFVARTIAMQGDLRRALPFLIEALPLCREFSAPLLTTLVLDMTASVVSVGGSPAACARLLGASEALRVGGPARVADEQAAYEDALAVLRTRLDEDLIAAALSAGRQLTASQALNEAEALVAAVASSSRGTIEPKQSDETLLSAREREVLVLLAQGRTNKEIGTQLGISDNTVKFHVTSIYQKLGVNGRAEAMSIAVTRALV